MPDSVKLPEGSANISDSFFRQKLTQYLYSPQGARYMDWFQFEDQKKPVCGEESPVVKVTSFSVHKGVLYVCVFASCCTRSLIRTFEHSDSNNRSLKK